MLERILKACSAGLVISLLTLVILSFIINQFHPEWFETKYPEWMYIDFIILIVGTLIIPLLWIIITRVARTDDYIQHIRVKSLKKFLRGKNSKWLENHNNIRSLIKYSLQEDNIFSIEPVDSDLLNFDQIENIFDQKIMPFMQENRLI